MNKNITQTITISLFLLLGTIAHAQQWRQFTTANELASNAITSMIEDQRSTLWVGTENGLSQFNHGFFIPHLDGKAVLALAESSDGHIWAGTSDGLWEYDGIRWSSHLADTEIRLLLVSSDSNIWVAGSEQLWEYHAGNWMSHDQPIETDSNDESSTPEIKSLVESSDGHIWLAISNGLWQYDGRIWQQRFKGQIQNLFASRNGHIWIVDLDTGLWNYDGKRWTQHLHESTFDFLGTEGILESSKGHIWIWSWRGLHQYNGASWEIHENAVEAISALNFTSLTESSDGHIWAGGFTQLSEYDGEKWNTHTEVGNNTLLLRGTSDGRIWAGTLFTGLWTYDGTGLQADDDLNEIGLEQLLVSPSSGHIWAASTSNAVWEYNGIGWKQHSLRDSTNPPFVPPRPFEYLIKSVLESSDRHIWVMATIVLGKVFRVGDGLWEYTGTKWIPHIVRKNVNIVLESSDGTIWAGTNRDHLWEYNGTEWKQHKEPLKRSIFALSESKGILWVGDSAGVLKYNRGTWHRFQELPEREVRLLWASSNGNIWAGVLIQGETLSKGDGLWEYNGTQWTIHKQFSKKRITFMFESSDGKIWAGTEADGLWEYNGTQWTSHKELDGRKINSLFESSNGTLWVATSHGLATYHQQHWRVLTRLDGLPDDDVRSIDEDRDGGLWIGTARGVARYSFNDNKPLIQITGVNGEGVTQTSTDLAYVTSKSIAVIEWQAADIETDTFRLTYQYRTDTAPRPKNTTANSVPISLVGVKQISFQVQAVDADLNRSLPAKITIHVLPRLTGDAMSPDGGARIYVPPNSLSTNDIITINRVPKDQIQPQPVGFLGIAYDIEPSELQFKRGEIKKPATLTISYAGVSVPEAQRVMIVRWEQEKWTPLGGTIHRTKMEVSTAINQLGRFALIAVDVPEADENAKILKKTLTCQPRAFSPRGGTFNPYTTISFKLDKPATATVKVYNVAGRLVKWVAHEQLLSAGRNALPWDGTDDNNKMVPIGPYIITVSIGNQTETKIVSVYEQ